jgi:hypothetical protein
VVRGRQDQCVRQSVGRTAKTNPSARMIGRTGLGGPTDGGTDGLTNTLVKIDVFQVAQCCNGVYNVDAGTIENVIERRSAFSACTGSI